MYKFKDIIEEVKEFNTDLKYGLDDIVGVTIEKGLIPTIANLTQTALDKFYIIKPGTFVYNPRTHGVRLGMGYNNTCNTYITSWNNIAFKVKDTAHSIVTPKYLWLFFCKPIWDRLTNFLAWGSSTIVFAWKDFLDIEIDLPPIEKQREIVSEYETLTRRIRLNEQMIEKLEATAQALYRHTFVDNIDKQNLPQGWHLATLGEVCSVITKGTTPSDYSENGPVNFVKAESISPNHYIDNKMLAHIDDNTHNIELKRSIIKENDILFTIAGTLGKFCIADKTFLPANTNQAVAIIRVDESKIHPIDIYAMFIGGAHEDYCKRNIQQAVQANLSLETISKLPILLLPDDMIKRFHQQIESVFCAIYLKQQENIKLTELQSLLLAKMGQ